MGSPTYFGQQSGGSQSSSSDYIKDTFDDYTSAATSNGTLTNNSSTNPLGASFANTDVPLYGVKTLWIKNITLIPDKSKWINNRPTYAIDWHESFPNVVGFFTGNVQLDLTGSLRQITYSSTQTMQSLAQSVRKQVNLNSLGDVFGVTGKIRKVQYILKKQALSAPLTVQCQIDGTNSTTISVSGNSVPIGYFEDTASLQTNDLHTYQLSAPVDTTLSVAGIVVYFENSGANFECLPGSTFVNKTKVTSTDGATFGIGASIGSSLGAQFTAYKDETGYKQIYTNLPAITSVGNGFSGTNLLTVSTGTGASFPAGVAILALQGSSTFLSNVISQSGDVLTLGNTMPYGISTSVIRSWIAGLTLPSISSTSMKLLDSITFNAPSNIGITNLPNNVYPGVLDYRQPTNGDYQISVLNVGFTQMTDQVGVAFFNGQSGVIQIDGYFQALDIDTMGAATLQINAFVNGFTSGQFFAGQSGIVKRNVFSNGGIGWNSVVLTCGPSHGAVGIRSINMYNYLEAPGVSYGKLASYDNLQALAIRPAYNATLHALGTYRRVRAAELYYQAGNASGGTGWTRQVGFSNVYGFEQYAISGTSAQVEYQYYGRGFIVQGTIGSSTTYTINGVSTGANAPSLILGTYLGASLTEGFQRVAIQNWSGSFAISAFDYVRSRGEITSQQQTKDQNIVKNNISTLNLFNINLNNYPFISVYQGATGIAAHNSITKFFYVNRVSDALSLYNTANGLWTAPRNCNVLMLASITTADLNYSDFRFSVSRNSSGTEDGILNRRFSSTNSNGVQTFFGLFSPSSPSLGVLNLNVAAGETWNFNIFNTNTSTTAMVIDTSRTYNQFLIMSVDNLPFFNINTLGKFF